jgi:hypothetical protein
MPSSSKNASNIDSILIAWNQVTLNSLKEQLNSASDPDLRELFANRIAAFKDQVNISTDDGINKKSIRHKLLEQIIDSLNKKDVFIVEANESGEKVLLRTFVLYCKDNGKTDIDIYIWNSSQWSKVKSVKNADIPSNDLQYQYLVRFPDGINYDDVVISSFNKSEVLNSWYYLYGTLPGNWFKILLTQYNIQQ